MYNTMSHNVFQLPATGNRDNHSSSSIFERASSLGLEDLHFKYDPITGLKAIVAIHSTNRGPALGGTRCLHYASENDAIEDVMRLARSMSYKSAFADLPFGGGKAVLMRPKQLVDADAYFECYGEFINTLNGRFITAVDVGTSVVDMDRISRRTHYVLSTTASHGDPSHNTAQGVLYGIKAAVKVCLNHDNLKGIRVAIQGVGKVGFHLAELLYQAKAKLIISDINSQAAQRCADICGADYVATDEIFSVNCDVIAPCALGSSINDDTLNLINAKIICGAANNQLASDDVGDMLYKKQIFYVPDYVVNAGGLIHVVLGSNQASQAKIAEIYNAVINIYQGSMELQESSHRTANRIAEQILCNSKKLVAHI